MLPFYLLLALIWGAIWAAFLQFVPLGKFLARHRTWFTVVIGVGGDMLILLAIIPFDVWLLVVLVVGLSSVFIITRSLYNEFHEVLEVLAHAKKDAR